MTSEGAKSRVVCLIDTIWGWVDSDWADDTDTRRSHDVYVLMLNDGPISRRQDSVALSTWKSRRQDSVPLSTCEAEYR